MVRTSVETRDSANFFEMFDISPFTPRYQPPVFSSPWIGIHLARSFSPGRYQLPASSRSVGTYRPMSAFPPIP